MSESLELLVTEGPRQGERFTPTEAGLKLGRASSCDIAITDLALSRNHCLFELRDESVWVTDLASANGTEVNGEPVTERELKVGDRVVVGDSVIEVVKKGGVAATVVEPAPADPIGPVDLGFSKEENPASGAPANGNNMLRALLWGVCAVVVLGVCGFFLMNGGSSRFLDKMMGRPDPQSQIDGLDIHEKPRLMSLDYEKLEASSDGIFRYAMAVGPEKSEQGVKMVLKVTVDDVLSDNRHVEKNAVLTQDKLDKLAQTVAASGVTKLEHEYTGIAARPNDLKCSRLKVVTTEDIFEISAENTTLPDEFRTVSEQLEAFSKNELGIWAIQYSTDKLVEMAEASMESGDAKWKDSEVQYGNIGAAIRHYREAIADLETVNPKPDFYEQLVEKLKTAKDELDKRYRDQSFECDRAISLEDWPQAQAELKILCEMLPTDDPRHGDAAAKLMDVESRMKK